VRAQKEAAMGKHASRRQDRRGNLRARSFAWAAGAVVAGLCAAPGTARADGFLDAPGQSVGVSIQAAMVTCSLVSIGGNAANIAMQNPQRGWMYSGYICGFMNTLISPIMFIFFHDAAPAYSLSTAGVHGAVGITNLGLAIYNGVLWHRARTAAAAKEPIKVSIRPMIGRDSLGGQLYGLSFGVASF
jgi:hypothetical protein